MHDQLCLLVVHCIMSGWNSTGILPANASSMPQEHGCGVEFRLYLSAAPVHAWHPLSSPLNPLNLQGGACVGKIAHQHVGSYKCIFKTLICKVLVEEQTLDTLVYTLSTNQHAAMSCSPPCLPALSWAPSLRPLRPLQQLFCRGPHLFELFFWKKVHAAVFTVVALAMHRTPLFGGGTLHHCKCHATRNPLPRA